MNRDFLIILKTILLDQIRQEFAGILDNIKKKLGIRLPNWINWSLAILMQNSLVLFIAFFLENFQDTPFWLIAVILILIFNLILPTTMARQNAIRISEHPLQFLLWQSPYDTKRLLFIWLTAETIMFWIYEMMFELTALYILIRIAPNWITASILVIVWLTFVSIIYYVVLQREILKKWGYKIVVSTRHELFYLFRLSIIAVFAGFIIQKILLPFTLHPISSDVLQQDLREGFSVFIQYFKKNLLQQSESLWNLILHNIEINIALFILCAILIGWIVTKYLFSSIQIRYYHSAHIKDTSNNWIFTFYHWLSCVCFPKNIWIQRDLLLIDRLRVYTRMPVRFTLFFPPALASVIAFTVLLPYSVPATSFSICFWFIGAFTLYQTAWLFIWNHPILHPSSELKQIELVYLSPIYQVGDFMQSKIKLMMILLFPFQLILSFLFTCGIILSKGSWTNWVIGLIGLWMLFFVISIFSTWWLALGSRFDYPHIFAVRMDTYEARLVQFVYNIPKRVITIGLFIVFFISFFSDHQLDQKIFYDVFLILLLILAIAFYVFWRIKQNTNYAK